MKYTTEIIIELPLEEMIQKLDNPENMKYWQKGLVSNEQLSGTPGEVGSKMKLEYLLKKRNMILTETILKNNFPDEFYASYETKGVYNKQQNYFKKTAEGYTKWISENEFKFDSFFMKAIGFLMPGVFKKQSLSYLKAFKDFAEKGISVNDN